MKTVLANGVFDILHIGHANLLMFSKSLGDRLVVAIDTDRRVKELKGNDRPINSQEDRKFILECIRYVDEVVVFDSKDELKSLYDTINPFVVVKGYEQKTPEEIRSHDEIPSHIKVILCPFQEGYSTTGTMRKIKSLSSWEKRNTV